MYANVPAGPTDEDELFERIELLQVEVLVMHLHLLEFVVIVDVLS